MPLRIVMLLDNPFRPDPRVIREAGALAEMGHRVTIYAWDRDSEIDRPDYEKYESFDVVRIRVKSKQQLGLRQLFYYFIFGWRVFWMTLRNNFDVVHCHDLLNLPIGIFLKLFKRVKLVYDAHEIYWIMEAQRYPRLILGLMKYSEILLLHWVDIFITVGLSRIEYYRQYFNRKIYLIGNWYNRREPDKQLCEFLRRDLGIPENAFVLTVAGKLSPERSTDVIIECARRLQEQGKPVHWLIAGRGPSQDVFIRESMKNPNLHVLGWVENTAALYSASNALVYLMDSNNPYTKFNVPNNLFLSIAWALPLVGINSGEISNILLPEITGILIDKVNVDDVFSGVMKLLERSDCRTQIIDNLKNLQKTYSWDIAKINLYEAYKQLYV
jgi:glycosyltransferase involved in cell wall biosynthesis